MPNSKKKATNKTPLKNTKNEFKAMDVSYQSFNLINWLLLNQHTTADLPVGDLYEYRQGYPSAKVLVDTTPPIGDVILNDNRTYGGIHIHEFTVLGGGGAIDPAQYVIADRLGNYLSVIDSNSFGKVTESSKYNTIGFKDNHSLIALFTGNETITGFQIGATASKAKHYLIELQVVGSTVWIPFLSMIASQDTGEFYQYNFINGITGIKAVRLRYRGDYFASINTGNSITVGAYDKLTNVVGIQISHYPDFSDATDMPGSDTDGWLPFAEGVKSYSWELSNTSRIWDIQPATVSLLQPIKQLLELSSETSTSGNNILIAIGTDTTYTMSYTDGEYQQMVQGYTFASNINCAAIYKNMVYVGLANGKIYRSYDGLNFGNIAIDQSGGSPITALAEYQQLLYIGTDESLAGGYAKIYTWDLSDMTFVKQLEPPTVTVFGKAKNSLYVGTKGVTYSKAGYVYRFNGQNTWTLSFDTLSDNVQSLVYSPVNDKLWCAVNNGKIYTASFSDNNNPIWNRTSFQENSSTIFYNIVSDPVKKPATEIGESPATSFVWICSNADFSVYVNSASKIQKEINGEWVDTAVDQYSFESVPVTSNPTTIQSVSYFKDQLFGGSADGRIYKFDLNYLSTSIKYVYVRLKDEAGNITSLPTEENYNYVYDWITQNTDRSAEGTRISDGHIYQVSYNPSDKDDISLVSSLITEGHGQGSITAPDRKVRSSGSYVSPPFYVANLTNWDSITFLYNFPACESPSDAGLDYGVQIDLFVKTANTRQALETTSWGNPQTETVINTSHTEITAATSTFEINALQGRWLQFYAVLTTASQNKSPELLNVSLFYRSSGSSYFFTSMFDTAKHLGNYRNYIANSDFETGVWPWETNGDKLTILTATDVDRGRVGTIQRRNGGDPGGIDAIPPSYAYAMGWVDGSLQNGNYTMGVTAVYDGGFESTAVLTVPYPVMVSGQVAIYISWENIPNAIAYRVYAFKDYGTFHYQTQVVGSSSYLMQNYSWTGESYPTTNPSLPGGGTDMVTTNPSSFLIEPVYSEKQFILSFYYRTTVGYTSSNMSARIDNITQATTDMDETIPASLTGDVFKKYFSIDSTVSADEYMVTLVLNNGTDDFDFMIDDIYIGPDYGVLSEDPPMFYRGLLTANTTMGQGSVSFAYTTDDGSGTFDFNNTYTEIVPNTVFEFVEPTSKVRFGILFTKTGTDPVIVHDFAVQLEAHDTDMKLMSLPTL